MLPIMKAEAGGGPAFPQTPDLELGRNGDIVVAFKGITVLDYFARAAMKELPSPSVNNTAESVKGVCDGSAKIAYVMAASMLAERERVMAR